MFKVICINSKVINGDVVMPKEGEVVTVVGESVNFPGSYYILEYPVAKCGTTQSIHKRHFIPLSEIDEMEYSTVNTSIESL